MISIKKVIGIILITLVVAPMAELLREFYVGQRTDWKLESAYSQIRYGMTKDQVRQLTSEPDRVGTGDSEQLWHWSGRNHEGLLREKLGLTWIKGHCDLYVRFDQEHRTTGIWGEVN